MTQRRIRAAAAMAAAHLVLCAVSQAACTGPGAGDSALTSSGSATPSAPASSVALSPADAAAPVDASSDDASAPDASSGDASAPDASSPGDVLPGTTEGCPDGMVMIAGDYCPDVLQKCLKHHEEFERDEEQKKAKRDQGEEVEASTVSERCLEYEQPSKCLSKKRRPLRFCMDRYEWPNKKGELPALLISWQDARKACQAAGKRLCTEDEFNFACEGEEMLPYTYGYTRDPSKCSIDKPYRKRKHKLLKFAKCMADARCKAELERLDQRLPAGSLAQCVSPFGVYDLNGNINEWVMRPGKKYPDRSGLKGGWWGPVRGRCRPTVGFHKEEDYGYEEGFRCCKDAEGP